MARSPVLDVELVWRSMLRAKSNTRSIGAAMKVASSMVGIVCLPSFPECTGPAEQLFDIELVVEYYAIFAVEHGVVNRTTTILGNGLLRIAAPKSSGCRLRITIAYLATAIRRAARMPPRGQQAKVCLVAHRG